jgi:hypothetical protein
VPLGKQAGFPECVHESLPEFYIIRHPLRAAIPVIGTAPSRWENKFANIEHLSTKNSSISSYRLLQKLGFCEDTSPGSCVQ